MRIGTVRPLCLLALVTIATACSHRDQPQAFQSAPLGSATSAVHEPAKLTSIEIDKVDALGNRMRVTCVTCHSARPPRTEPVERPEDLKEFHTGLTFRHGSNSCASCHVHGAPDALHLADGSRIPMVEAMTLCGQCHGPQLRDYKAGAHGGMSGHWDTGSGPRLRNHCVDCHDPHTPKFVPSTPVLPPRDRNLGSPISQAGGPVIPKLGGGAHP